MLTDNSFMKEVFFEGSPYTGGAFFEDLGRYGVAADFLDYYRATRTPVPDLSAFIEERKDRIEVINLIFADDGLRAAMRERLEGIPCIETTTSLGFNLEVGAKGASKGEALSRLCEMLGVEPARTLSCGDNDNDISMLAFSGIGVAMGNGTDNAKAAADFVTKPNDEDGVAFALGEFVFRQP
jgi:hydroxymethylpyrimidine pyrophosphatase-like HAD family hydrolase